MTHISKWQKQTSIPTALSQKIKHKSFALQQELKRSAWAALIGLPARMHNIIRGKKKGKRAPAMEKTRTIDVRGAISIGNSARFT